MKVILPQDMKSSIPNNGMLVRTNNAGPSGTLESSWKLIFDDEARKVNPLFDIKIKRNDLIMESIRSDDWTRYHEFQAKQHPAWYEQVDGRPVQNKIYYGNLIESKIRSLQEAKASADQGEILKWEKSLEEAINDFNHAPGIVPYIVGLNHTSELASRYGVPEPGDEYFDSKWNSSLVLSQGKFEQNMWHENPYFQENASAKQHVEELAAGTFPTSIDKASEAKSSFIEENSLDQNLLSENQLDGNSVSLQTMFFTSVSQISKAYKPSFTLVKERYR
ncbi:hypothetical protein [Cytobacillus sp. NCCP-133]|uniref:hypothetical protein n=1 Tax=Cytobacillus sp. NCCP-133 TaxID=766848 RepID=UPI00223059B9|nr:hypothetical protein [Cytobacillus sp. NCCP-133]GLB60230.1 hypothetical protein NCCP133_23620 [Cytobacillus sp. NCCP-133]